MSNWLLPTLAGLVAGILFLFTVFVWHEIVLAFRSKTWPHVEGQVTKAELEVGGGDTLSYRPRVFYEYRVGDLTYHGDRYRFGFDFAFASSTEGERAMRGMTPGQPVTVRHHPDKPALCTLKAGSSWELVVFGLIIPLFLVVWVVREGGF